MVRTAAVLIAALCVSVSANAATCKAPSTPEISGDGATMSVDQFNTITEDLIAYDGSLNTYRQCLDGILETPESHTAQEWRSALDAYNGVALTQSAVYARYDEVSLDFQTYQKKRAFEAAEKASTESVVHSQQALASEMAKINN